MAHFADLALSVAPAFALFLLFLPVLLLAICLDDALLGLLVLTMGTGFAGLWWSLHRLHHLFTPSPLDTTENPRSRSGRSRRTS
jgi:hypothetical protein